MQPDKLTAYARLGIETGLRVQEGDIVSIAGPVEAAEFVRETVRIAYENGAKEVLVDWIDDPITRMRFEHEALEQFETFPAWRKQRQDDLADRRAKFLHIVSEDPDLLAGIDSEKIVASNQSRLTALKKLREAQMNDVVSWCILAVPGKIWAKKVFPDLPEETAMERLWDEIFSATRMREANPVAAWEAHLTDMTARADRLNAWAFETLHYTTKKGTDLTIRLPEGHIWAAACSANTKGETFVPNLPTDEVFTMPDKYGVDGVVYSTKPLVYNGQMIEDFKLRFEGGKVVEYSAGVGEKALTELFQVDDNARRLGEVALVPVDAPIAKANVVFFNTLFDENASCHLAFGKAYPTNIQGGADMSEEELDAHHVNDSLVHEDFMIGDETLNIVGTTKDGQKIPLFQDGLWAF